MSRERGILFSGPMVRAILAGAKTQTRRLGATRIAAGDTLWVREAWRTTTDLHELSGGAMATLCVDAGYRTPWAPLHYEADGVRSEWPRGALPGRYRHARFMPRWASRLTLRVTGVRSERLGDISAEDAVAEGSLHWAAALGTPWPSRDAFAALWNDVHGPGAWARDADATVSVIAFEVAR